MHSLNIIKTNIKCKNSYYILNYVQTPQSSLTKASVSLLGSKLTNGMSITSFTFFFSLHTEKSKVCRSKRSILNAWMKSLNLPDMEKNHP